MESHPVFNNLDYIVFAILALSGLLALIRGFVREVLSLASWVGAYFFAAHYYPLAEPTVHHYINKTAYIPVVSSIVVFLGALVAFTLVSHLITKLIRGQALTAIDRSLGLIFGVARGALVICIVYLAIESYIGPTSTKAKPGEQPTVQERNQSDEETKDSPPLWLVNAKTFPAIRAGSNYLRTFLPQKDIDKITHGYLEQKSTVQKKIDENALDILSSPTPSGSNSTKDQGYDDQSRQQMINQLGQKGAP